MVTRNLSLIADPFALNNIPGLKWIEYCGTKWRVSTVEISYPRLTLTLGGIYNGVD